MCVHKSVNMSFGPLQKASTKHYTIQIQKVLFLFGHIKNNKHTLWLAFNWHTVYHVDIYIYTLHIKYI
jgi:hypothetical protein